MTMGMRNMLDEKIRKSLEQSNLDRTARTIHLATLVTLRLVLCYRYLFKLLNFDLFHLWIYCYHESSTFFEWELRIFCHFGRNIDEVFVVLLSSRRSWAVDESAYPLKCQIGVT